MIPSELWIAQIALTAEFLGNRNCVRKVWVEKDSSITSIIDFYELYEQIFDDLDSDRFEHHLTDVVPDDENAQVCIRDFLHAIHKVDQEISQNAKLLDANLLLNSGVWAELESISRQLVAIPVIQKAMRNFNTVIAQEQ